MIATGLRARSQDPPASDQVGLADELVEVARPHPLGQRLSGPVGFGRVPEQVSHDFASSFPFAKLSI
jgi:hypothetical protein